MGEPLSEFYTRFQDFYDKNRELAESLELSENLQNCNPKRKSRKYWNPEGVPESPPKNFLVKFHLFYDPLLSAMDQFRRNLEISAENGRSQVVEFNVTMMVIWCRVLERLDRWVSKDENDYRFFDQKWAIRSALDAITTVLTMCKQPVEGVKFLRFPQIETIDSEKSKMYRRKESGSLESQTRIAGARANGLGRFLNEQQKKLLAVKTAEMLQIIQDEGIYWQLCRPWPKYVRRYEELYKKKFPPPQELVVLPPPSEDVPAEDVVVVKMESESPESAEDVVVEVTTKSEFQSEDVKVEEMDTEEDLKLESTTTTTSDGFRISEIQNPVTTIEMTSEIVTDPMEVDPDEDLFQEFFTGNSVAEDVVVIETTTTTEFLNSEDVTTMITASEDSRRLDDVSEDVTMTLESLDSQITRISNSEDVVASETVTTSSEAQIREPEGSEDVHNAPESSKVESAKLEDSEDVTTAKIALKHLENAPESPEDVRKSPEATENDSDDVVVTEEFIEFPEAQIAEFRHSEDVPRRQEIPEDVGRNSDDVVALEDVQTAPDASEALVQAQSPPEGPEDVVRMSPEKQEEEEDVNSRESTETPESLFGLTSTTTTATTSASDEAFVKDFFVWRPPTTLNPAPDVDVVAGTSPEVAPTSSESGSEVSDSSEASEAPKDSLTSTTQNPESPEAPTSYESTQKPSEALVTSFLAPEAPVTSFSASEAPGLSESLPTSSGLNSDAPQQLDAPPTSILAPEAPGPLEDVKMSSESSPKPTTSSESLLDGDVDDDVAELTASQEERCLRFWKDSEANHDEDDDDDGDSDEKMDSEYVGDSEGSDDDDEDGEDEEEEKEEDSEELERRQVFFEVEDSEGDDDDDEDEEDEVNENSENPDDVDENSESGNDEKRNDNDSGESEIPKVEDVVQNPPEAQNSLENPQILEDVRSCSKNEDSGEDVENPVDSESVEGVVDIVPRIQDSSHPEAVASQNPEDVENA